MPEISNNEMPQVDITLVKSLDYNVFQFKQVFKDDDTFKFRYFNNRENGRVRFCVLYLDGMVDADIAEQNIIEPVLKASLPEDFENNMDVILNQVITSNQAEKSRNSRQLVGKILAGDTILLMENSDEALTISTKGWKSRDITEPENERILRGPREGFVEPILVNLSLIRRRLATPNLKFKFMTIGVQTQTKISVCYIDGIVNPRILDELFQRLNKIKIDGILASGYIVELIKDSPYSPFKTIGSTEKPDAVCADLLEGRIAIVVDGTPVALTLPFLFEEYFQADEDYYINFFFSTISRVLRLMAFIITVASPGIYVAVLTFHQEMIPTPLLMSLSAAREGIPFPTIVETLGMLLIFEILREAGIRMPSHIGQSLSILGALVLGTAAVDARIVSASVIILVALSGLTGLITPKIKGPAIVLRLILTLLSGFLGLYGFVFGVMGAVLHLCSIRSFGVPYMMSFTSLNPGDLKDTVVRTPLWFMKTRPRFISGKNKVRYRSE